MLHLASTCGRLDPALPFRHVVACCDTGYVVAGNCSLLVCCCNTVTLRTERLSLQWLLPRRLFAWCCCCCAGLFVHSSSFGNRPNTVCNWSVVLRRIVHLCLCQECLCHVVLSEKHCMEALKQMHCHGLYRSAGWLFDYPGVQRYDGRG
jgi:hypothetical protein